MVERMTGMAFFGEVLVWLAAVLSICGGLAALACRQPNRAGAASRGFLLAAAAAGGAAIFALLFLLVNHDTRVAYVHDHTDRSMPLVYVVSALWSGQEGSLLLWAAIQCGVTAVVSVWAPPRLPRLAPVATAFLAAVQAFFLLLVIGRSDPFGPLIAAGTPDGLGMNPLLRNPFMAIHPPALYLGFVGFSTPAAFAVASLAAPGPREPWIPSVRPWILWAWIFLGLGNLLGMAWAYGVLGWGGYWGWDPVENSSLVPWLLATALLHSAVAEERMGAFRRASTILAVAVFDSVIFATFLTRSDVVESVHAFAGSPTGPWILGLVVAITVLAVALAAARGRRDETPGSRPLAPELSRGFLLAVTLGTLIAASSFVWLATLSPLFVSAARGETAAAPPDLYNRWMPPLGLVLLFVLASCTLTGWKGEPIRRIARRSIVPGIVGGASIAIAFVVSRRAGFHPSTISPYAVLGLVGLSIGAAVQEIVHLTASASGRGSFDGGWRRRLAAQIVHLAVALLFLGFSGSAFRSERSAALGRGDVMEVGAFRVKLDGLKRETGYDRDVVRAALGIVESRRDIGELSPARLSYRSHPDVPVGEIAIRSTLVSDLYVAMGETDVERGVALVRVIVNPLTAWIWIGGSLLVVATLVGLPARGWAGRMVSNLGRRRLSVAFWTLAVAAVIVCGIALGPEIGMAGACAFCVLTAARGFGNAVSALSTRAGKLS